MEPAFAPVPTTFSIDFSLKNLDHAVKSYSCFFCITGLYWLGYEAVKGTVVQQRQDQQLRFAESFVAGAVSGSVSINSL